MNERLRAHLLEAAHEVRQVDLHDRVLVAARKATQRRRTAFGVAVVAAVLAGAFAVALPGGDGRNQPAGPIATPAPLPPPLTPAPAGPWSERADSPADRSLDGMPLIVPDWPGAKPGETCPGPAVLHGGTATVPDGERSQQLRLVKAVTGNLTGAPTVLALFYCDHGRRGYQFQVVAYQKTDHLELVGQVLASRPEVIEATLDIAIVGNDAQIEVGDWAAGQTIGEDSHYSVRQWRSYRWIGGPFQQTAGPIAFPPNPNFHDLVVTTSELRLSPATSGVRHGTLTATVTNSGTGTAPAGTAVINLHNAMTFQSAGSSCAGGPLTARGTDRLCPYGQLQPGTGTRITVAVTVDAAAVTDLTGAALRITLADDPSDTISRGDNNRGNNSVPYRVTLS